MQSATRSAPLRNDDNCPEFVWPSNLYAPSAASMPKNDYHEYGRHYQEIPSRYNDTHMKESSSFPTVYRSAKEHIARKDAKGNKKSVPHDGLSSMNQPEALHYSQSALNRDQLEPAAPANDADDSSMIVEQDTVSVDYQDKIASPAQPDCTLKECNVASDDAAHSKTAKMSTSKVTQPKHSSPTTVKMQTGLGVFQYLDDDQDLSYPLYISEGEPSTYNAREAQLESDEIINSEKSGNMTVSQEIDRIVDIDASSLHNPVIYPENQPDKNNGTSNDLPPSSSQIHDRLLNFSMRGNVHVKDSTDGIHRLQTSTSDTVLRTPEARHEYLGQDDNPDKEVQKHSVPIINHPVQIEHTKSDEIDQETNLFPTISDTIPNEPLSVAPKPHRRQSQVIDQQAPVLDISTSNQELEFQLDSGAESSVPIGSEIGGTSKIHEDSTYPMRHTTLKKSLRKLFLRDYFTALDLEQMFLPGSFVTAFCIKGTEHFQIPCPGHFRLRRSHLEAIICKGRGPDWWKDFCFLEMDEIANVNRIMIARNGFRKTLVQLKQVKRISFLMKSWTRSRKALVAIIINEPSGQLDSITIPDNTHFALSDSHNLYSDGVSISKYQENLKYAAFSVHPKMRASSGQKTDWLWAHIDRQSFATSEIIRRIGELNKIGESVIAKQASLDRLQREQIGIIINSSNGGDKKTQWKLAQLDILYHDPPNEKIVRSMTVYLVGEPCEGSSDKTVVSSNAIDTSIGTAMSKPYMRDEYTSNVVETGPQITVQLEESGINKQPETSAESKIASDTGHQDSSYRDRPVEKLATENTGPQNLPTVNVYGKKLTSTHNNSPKSYSRDKTPVVPQMGTNYTNSDLQHAISSSGTPANPTDAYPTPHHAVYPSAPSMYNTNVIPPYPDYHQSLMPALPYRRPTVTAPEITSFTLQAIPDERIKLPYPEFYDGRSFNPYVRDKYEDSEIMRQLLLEFTPAGDDETKSQECGVEGPTENNLPNESFSQQLPQETQRTGKRTEVYANEQDQSSYTGRSSSATRDTGHFTTKNKKKSSRKKETPAADMIRGNSTMAHLEYAGRTYKAPRTRMEVPDPPDEESNEEAHEKATKPKPSGLEAEISTEIETNGIRNMETYKEHPQSVWDPPKRNVSWSKPLEKTEINQQAFTEAAPIIPGNQVYHNEPDEIIGTSPTVERHDIFLGSATGFIERAHVSPIEGHDAYEEVDGGVAPDSSKTTADPSQTSHAWPVKKAGQVAEPMYIEDATEGSPLQGTKRSATSSVVSGTPVQ
ncbi:hypothetical protein ACMFMF_007011 [Clarireedia jacksonii]